MHMNTESLNPMNQYFIFLLSPVESIILSWLWTMAIKGSVQDIFPQFEAHFILDTQ